MYQLMLTFRYLFSKVMPLLASLGVMLCAGVVLITWSVMGGFLDMLINTGRTMTGDVVVRWAGSGFAHYEDLVRRLEQDALVEAATPAIEAFGMVTLPDGSTKGIMVRGVRPDYARVTRYRDILWWRSIAKPLPKDKQGNDPRLGTARGTPWDVIYSNGLNLTRPDPATGQPTPAVVPGIHVTGMNRRYPEGYYWPQLRDRRRPDGTIETIETIMPLDGSVTLTMLPIDRKGKPLDPYSRIVPVANEFQSGVFDLDANVILANLDLLQGMLKMNEGKRLAENGGTREGQEPGGFAGDAGQPALVTDPARVTDVLVRGKGEMNDPRDARSLRVRVEQVYEAFHAAHPADTPSAYDIVIMTWEEQNATFINAVRNEISLLLVLFCFLSLTVVFLVIAIFWAMIREKTMDIGVLRAVGASRAGVAGVWLLYGLAIGVVGSSLGVALSYLVVININPIHDWMGRALKITIWDPNVYYFTKIPNEVNAMHAAIVFVCGVLSCVIGALIPAARAARMNPVRALRNE